MCQKVLISQNVVRMSKRAYNHRVELVTPGSYRVGQLARLNRDLDNLYELIYGQWRTVTKEDYKFFGGQFELLLDTLKELYGLCRKAPKEMGLKEETKKLGLNYSALFEVNSDIVNFGIKAANEDLKSSLSKAGSLMAKM